MPTDQIILSYKFKLTVMILGKKKLVMVHRTVQFTFVSALKQFWWFVFQQSSFLIPTEACYEKFKYENYFLVSLS